MAIPAAVLIKGGLGLGVLGAGATGVYFLSNKAPVATITQSEPELSSSKYDKALLSFLDGANNDIVFDVKKGDSGNTDFADADLNLATENSPVKAKVQVTVNSGSTSSSNLKIGEGVASSANLTDFSNLGDSTWTWSCEFTFTKVSGANQSSINNTYKDRIIAGNNKGLFNILKKDLHNYTDETGKLSKAEIKDIKKNFIRQCADTRGVDNNKTADTSLTNNALTTSVGIEFTNGTETNETASLVPTDKSKFEKWFKAEYGTKEIKA